MLNPDVVVDAVYAAILTIDELPSILRGDISRVTAFHYEGGVEKPLINMLYELPSPGVLINWNGTLASKNSATYLFKHLVEVYLRGGNMALDANFSPGRLWWTICNRTVSIPGYCDKSANLNIRQVQLIPAKLEVMDIPSIAHRTDQDGQDFFCGSFTIPEIGDQTE